MGSDAEGLADKPAAGPEAGGAAAEGKGQGAGRGPADSGPQASGAKPVEQDERFLRLLADFENFRKRVLREKSDAYRQAHEDLMRGLLSVLDHLDLAVAAAETHNAEGPVVDGFRLVGDELLGVLQKYGLKPEDAAGARFDHAVHEAIAYQPSAEVPKDHIIRQTRRGYRLGDRLLRAAQVIVSNGPSAGPAEKPGAPGAQAEG
jgi:molecular chaperone GrpE